MLNFSHTLFKISLQTISLTTVGSCEINVQTVKQINKNKTKNKQ